MNLPTDDAITMLICHRYILSASIIPSAAMERNIEEFLQSGRNLRMPDDRRPEHIAYKRRMFRRKTSSLSAFC